MQEHVHAANTEHGAVEVVAVEGAGVKAQAAGLVFVDAVAVVLAQVLGGGDEEAGRAAGGIADHILGRGGGHLDH